MSYYVNQREQINDSFVSAVFNIDVDEVKRLLPLAEYDKSLLNNVCSKEWHFCPINWITQLWEAILVSPESWREEYRERIVKKQKDNQEIKRILKENLNITSTKIELDNNDLWIYRWFADDPFEEFFDCSKEDMINKGHKAIDLDLYYAVNQYNFKEAERLLELGADPNRKIPEEGSWCLDLVGGRCSLYCMEISHILLEDQNQSGRDYRDLAYLLAWGVNEMMYKLLTKYSE